MSFFLLSTLPLLATVLAAENDTLDLPFVNHQEWVQRYGREGCDLANSVRASYGRHTLYYSASLTDLGHRHSSWMGATGNFQHQNLNGLGVWVGRNWLPVTAENIAMSRPRSGSAAVDAHSQWYHSHGHFVNMISSSHTHCGVGIAYDHYGRWWGTQLFGYNPNIGHEYGGGGSGTSARPAPAPAFRPAPAPAPARAPAPAPAPAARPSRTPRPERDPNAPRPSPLANPDLDSALLGEPLALDVNNLPSAPSI